MLEKTKSKCGCIRYIRGDDILFGYCNNHFKIIENFMTLDNYDIFLALGYVITTFYSFFMSY